MRGLPPAAINISFVEKSIPSLSEINFDTASLKESKPSAGG